MDLSFLLLTIISRLNGERTIYAGLHLFRGKRSGQTLQDVDYYSLKEFFCILPKLKIETFELAAEKLTKAGYISIGHDSLVHLTQSGWDKVSSLPPYHFNGWDYRGKEQLFFARLSLVVQTVSNFRVGQKSFLPLQRDYEIQLFVRNLLNGQPISEAGFSSKLRIELHQVIENSEITDVQKTILTHRLGGYENTGWTWNQLAEKLSINPVTIRLYFIESLHMLLGTIEQSSSTPFMQRISENIKVTSYLTDSSMKTKVLFDQGMSMANIAKERRLKTSTIEDHFVEMSINDSQFPVEKFFSNMDLDAVRAKSVELGTKRLRLLKDEFPTLSYFQLRLILGSEAGGETKWTSKKF